MYSASRITPVQRMRRQSSSSISVGSSTRAVSPKKQGPRRSSLTFSTTNSATSSLSIQGIKMNGDYQVLRCNVDRDRKAVQDARVALATSLDQLGEHHVRQKEYDDAMDAFTEALREKRSVFWNLTHNDTFRNHYSTVHSRGSSYNSSFLSGTTASTTTTAQGGTTGDEDESTTFSNKDLAGQDVLYNIHDQAIDELVNTLRNMGNVHSLRGEQDEAMRYFTEVTALRAQKTCSLATTSDAASVDTRSLLSGLNDENSTLMSEINEDVKALDDLFRSISFRNNANGSRGSSISPEVAPGNAEKRKSKSGTPSNKKRRGNSTTNNRRSSTSSLTSLSMENEPFNRASAALSLSHIPPETAGLCNEASEAIEMYKAAIDMYVGPQQRHEQHKEMLNSMALRVDLLDENRLQALSSTCPTNSTAVPEVLYNTSENVTQVLSTKAADLELALEIYQNTLLVHQESGRNARGPSTSSMSSIYSTSFASNDSASSTTSRSTPNTDVAGNPRRPQPESSNEFQEQQQEQHHDQQQQEQLQQVASNIASTLICMGSIHYKVGNRVEELHMYQEAKKVYKIAFGENHVFVAGTRKNIGMVLAERGEYEEAMIQFEKAMKIYLAVNNDIDQSSTLNNSNGETDLDQSPSSQPVANGQLLNRDVASAISCMGNVKNRTGELDAALNKYMQALQIYKSLYHQALSDANSSCSPASIEALRDVTSTLKVIGMVHAKKGDLDTAMDFFQEAMALLRTMEVASIAILGCNGMDGISHDSVNDSNVDKTSRDAASAVVRETTASVLTRIAGIHLKKGDLDSAMSYYREAYDMTIRNRGTTNHSEVAGILHYIGGIYHKRQDYDEAMACYQESIRIYHATLGPGNPTVAGTLVMMGSIHYKRRQLDNAMMFYREALRLNRDAYGMHHPDVAPILKSIGTILTKKGEYDEAYDIFRDVLSIKCTVHGTDHPEVASAYKSLGNVHYKMGALADAERQYRHALSIYRRCKGEDHADTVAAKTTIEHLRYWMRERDQRRQMEQRQSQNSRRHGGGGGGGGGGGDGEEGKDDMNNEERSC